jgi:hypothetical protein
MPDWIGIAISGVALCVSAYSLFIARRTAQRAIDAEKVSAWIEIAKSSDKEWFVCTVHVKNPSRHDIKLEKLSVDLPDFRIADVWAAYETSSSGEVVLKQKVEIEPKDLILPLSLTIKTGETKEKTFCLYQPAHSQQKSTKVNVMYWTLEPVQQWRSLPVTVEIRTGF